MDRIFSILGEFAIAGVVIYAVKKGNEYLKLKQEEYKNNKFDNDTGE